MKFGDYVYLVKTAEMRFAASGLSAPQSLSALRGIYYGTAWSVDKRVEHSWLRTVLFAVLAGSIAIDPRTILGDKLFAALASNQDLAQGQFQLDVGHMLIGMDARVNGTSDERELASTPLGGNPLEVVTWLGDLGGGAAHLTFKRATGVRDSVGSVFVNTGGDYGHMSNLEGDVAAYVVGESTNGLTLPSSSTPIADLLNSHFPGPRSTWARRASLFTALSGVTGDGATAPPQTIEKIETLAVTYLIYRYIAPGKLKEKQIDLACQNVHGAATEVALTFAKALARSSASSGPITGAPPWPPPTPVAPCSSNILRTVSTGAGIRKELDELRKQINDFIKSM